MRVHPAANTTIPPLRNRQRHGLHPALLLLHAGPDPPESIVWKPTLTPGALPTNCNTYVQAKSGDTCRTILATYTFVTQQQFFAWLPFLNGNCNGLLAGYWYCTMACDWNALPMPPTVTTTPSLVPMGTTSSCKAWYYSTGSDRCAFIASIFGTFSQADFISWNPSVGTSCGGITKNTWYCVGIPGMPTTRSSPVPTTQQATGISRPIQPGIASNCQDFWLVSRTDTCASITDHLGLPMIDFLTLNPALGSSCTLTPDYYVCVRLAGSGGGGGASSTTSSGGITSSPPSSGTSRPSSTSISSAPL